MKKLLALLLLATFFVSCSSDDDNNTPSINTNELLGSWNYVRSFPKMIITDNQEVSNYIESELIKKEYYLSYTFISDNDLLIKYANKVDSVNFKIIDNTIGINDIVPWAYSFYPYITQGDSLYINSNLTEKYRHDIPIYFENVSCKIDTVIQTNVFSR